MKRAMLIHGILIMACMAYFSAKKISEIEKGVEYVGANAPNINYGKEKNPEKPDQKKAAPAEPKRRRIMNPEQIYDQADYVVKLKIFKSITLPFSGQVIPIDTGSFGSGSIVKCQKYKHCVLTAFHVVNESSMTYFAEFRDGSKAQMLELISGTTTYDTAILRFIDNKYKPKKTARLGKSSSLRPGSPIYAIGSNRFGDFWMSGDGRLYTTVGSAKYELKQILESYGSNHPDLLLFNTPIFRGFSGGPLHNKYGEVIGVTIMMIPLDMEPVYIGAPIDGIKKTLKILK